MHMVINWIILHLLFCKEVVWKLQEPISLWSHIQLNLLITWNYHKILSNAELKFQGQVSLVRSEGWGSTGQPKWYIQFAHSFAENVQKLSAMWDRKAWLM